MPEDLLLELETAAPVAGSLENIEDLLRVVVRELGRTVRGMKGTALTFENAWRDVIMHVAKGHTTEIQGARPHMLSSFEEWLSYLKRTHTLLTWLHGSGQAALPNPEALMPEIAGMERLKARVFDLWQTADDLEDLAARDYPLTTADLDEIGPKRRPAASWYAEEGKPF